METALILVRQILQMFLYAGIGYVLFKTGRISQDGSKALGNILIYVALPAVIIRGFLVSRTTENTAGLLWSAGAAAVLLLVSICVARFSFRKDAVGAFASAFSNPGFFGIPLIIASVGEGAVFYAAPYIAFLNLCQWTWGVSVLTGQPVLKGFQARKLLTAPFTIAILVGLILYFTQFRLPEIVSGCLTAAASLNTPLAMFTVGVYLGQTDIRRMFQRKVLYGISAVRLLLVPALALLLLSLLPASLREIKTALLLAAACPVGSNVAVYAQLHDQDYPYAVETVVISTLWSVLTIPAIVWLSSLLW